MFNIKRFNNVLKEIENNPGEWNQMLWHMEKQHCFSGIAEIHALENSKRPVYNQVAKDLRDGKFNDLRHIVYDGHIKSFVLRTKNNNGISTYDRARKWIGSSIEEHDWLSSSFRLVSEFKMVSEKGIAFAMSGDY